MADDGRVPDDWSRRLIVRPLADEDARCIAAWRYAGAWQVYNLPAGEPRLHSADGYWAVALDEVGRLVGFCCAGGGARVPGLFEESGLLDVGLGIAPELVGTGHGLAFGEVVTAHLRREHPGRGLRAAVQAWNERSLQLTRRLGFVEVGRHLCQQAGRGVEYVIVVAE